MCALGTGEDPPGLLSSFFSRFVVEPTRLGITLSVELISMSLSIRPDSFPFMGGEVEDRMMYHARLNHNTELDIKIP